MKQIKLFPRYSVCSNGDIFSGDLKLKVAKWKGYNYVRLYKDGKQYKFYVARLVASMYIENPDNKKEVNHIDGDKNNNDVSNLEWVTPSENCLHRERTGLGKNCKGENARNSKHTQLDVDYIRKLYDNGVSVKDISVSTGFRYDWVWRITKRKQWC